MKTTNKLDALTKKKKTQLGDKLKKMVNNNKDKNISDIILDEHDSLKLARLCKKDGFKYNEILCKIIQCHSEMA